MARRYRLVSFYEERNGTLTESQGKRDASAHVSRFGAERGTAERGYDEEDASCAEHEIAARVAEIGRAITRDYACTADEGGIVLISVLRGAAIFMADLARKIELPVEMDYLAVSSYGNGAKSSGVVRILKDLTSEIEGRHVIVAEDILDSGLTLTYLLKNLSSRHPASLEVATLLRKKTPAQAKIDCKYLGFECPDDFIVGYGLDFAERYRNLPCIGILKPEIYQ